MVVSRKRIIRTVQLATLLFAWGWPGIAGSLLVAAEPVSCRTVHNYVFFNADRERIKDPVFLNTKELEGAQIKYTWKELEPEQDKYDFSPIQEDLDFLSSRGKHLFVQIQDVTFDIKRKNVPKYLLTDPSYHGGVAETCTDDEKVSEGWVARRWDSAVQDRFARLLAELGNRFDGKIEGINLPETAVDFGESGKRYPEGFTPAAYRDAVLVNMSELKKSFPKSVTVQYANFMPGEFLPENDHGYLRSVYDFAVKAKIGVGGPDLLPHKPGQMNNCYAMIRTIDGKVQIALAAQEGNYQHKNPETGKEVTISEMFDFGRDYLKANYIFWCTQEPYFSGKLIPYLKRTRP